MGFYVFLVLLHNFLYIQKFDSVHYLNLRKISIVIKNFFFSAGNEPCPQPQTSEHLAAIEIMKLHHILILQNKIDLVKEGQAKEQYDQILKFVQGTVAENAPVIPISAQLKYNIEVLCEYVTKKIPIPLRDFSAPPRLIVIRSFDVNKPGCEVEDLKGGVAGGSLLQGVLKVHARTIIFNLVTFEFLNHSTRFIGWNGN